MTDRLSSFSQLLPNGVSLLPSFEMRTAALPSQRTRFVGRERLIEAVRRRLLLDDTRLLTLTGPGGTGKTRLALEVAAEVQTAYPGGVCFVPLAQVAEPGLVLPAVAQALGVKESPERTLMDALVVHLKASAALLLLDKFEHLVEAAPTIAALLAACPRLDVLATSRAALKLSGEQEIPVPPLAVPANRAAPTARYAADFEAVRLFTDRAQAVRPDFALTDENVARVVEICHRLDGLPLAIELAAARLRSLPLPALADRMERRLLLLTGGPRDLPTRQRTLRDTIAWSYDLLSADEQTLFRRLAVFRGCTLEAIQAVCTAANLGPGATSVDLPALNLDPLDGATSLVEQSLLQQGETEDGQPWYVMLETIHEFALERLAESNEREAIERRHIWHYLRLAEAAEPQLTGPDQAPWLARLEREHDNLRAAIRWCVTKGYGEPALRLALALWWFWTVHGHLVQGGQIMAGVLDRFRPRDPSRRLLGWRARALQAAGYLSEFQGDLGAARRHLEEALRLFRGLDDGFGVESALGALGQVALLDGSLPEAEGLVGEALERARARNDAYSIGALLGTLADIVHQQGDFPRARALIEEGLDVKRHFAAPREMALHILHLSVMLEEQHEYATARDMCERGLAICRGSNDQRITAFVQARLAGLATLDGDFETARRALGECLPVLDGLGDPGGVAFALEGCAVFAAAQERPARALRLAGAATALRTMVGASLPSAARLAGFEERMMTARQVLGGAAADAAWADGWALSRHDAVVEALADLEPERLAPVPVEPRSIRLAPPASGPDRSGSAPRISTTLSARELEVAILIGRGYKNRQIAADLVISQGTVANHVVHILDRLGFHNRAQIAVWASENGLLG
jgi:predicted ATPase/DNA-binding CsgD family transcriptional regulator